MVSKQEYAAADVSHSKHSFEKIPQRESLFCLQKLKLPSRTPAYRTEKCVAQLVHQQISLPCFIILCVRSGRRGNNFSQ